MDFLTNIRRRARIISAIRAFFDAQGFTEVSTPVAVAAPAPEPHIDCPGLRRPLTSAPGEIAKGTPPFLRASPELQMKKLLAAGLDKIYQIGPCFREGELGSRHNPEFTMIEWYRLNADYRDVYADMISLLTELTGRAGAPRTPQFGVGVQDGRAGAPRTPQVGVDVQDGRAGAPRTPQFGVGVQDGRAGAPRTPQVGIGVQDGRAGAPRTPNIDMRAEFTIRELYRTKAGWDPFVSFDQDRFDYDMATKIETSLPPGFVSLWDYPKEAASLARLRGDVAERWELYYNGIELANCFTELCDGPEQRRRFVAAKEERRALGESDYPLDEEFLNLLPLIKSASGVALGVDRLVAVLCGESDIHAVMAGE